ncbi:single-stranded DNA-binding protein [Puniceicoccales bacterium CK1056]|uniref:Single-stranded DNA-binding protein n=1 Tax=Oceanipulchritudo coccoides TaxID=2706888 RepID=A0A6B2LZK3_9BACT|nr:single-stranded DNA-binding protein [Oceanipulchritudo coccoides]NDV61374.1 single-stranded DNA-binding protein [Oceanipulchritudo coccoides]
MASFNKVILMGNLTRDPEVRTTPSGLKIAKFGLAVNRKYRTRDNELKEETTFVDIDAFGTQAETLERYCEKGSPLLVEGRLRLDQWQTSNGENRSKLSVVLENFQLMGGRSAAPESKSSEATAPKPQPSKDNTLKGDDDIPF